MVPNFLLRLFALFFLVVLPISCTPIIAGYDLDAYKNATSLKARSLALIDSADKPYATNSAKADSLMVDIDKAYEFSAGISNNDISAEQWSRIRDPRENFVGGFIEFWKAQSKGVSSGFQTEAKIGIGKAFDYIICLEANKREATPCASRKDDTKKDEAQ